MQANILHHFKLKIKKMLLKYRLALKIYAKNWLKRNHRKIILGQFGVIVILGYFVSPYRIVTVERDTYTPHENTRCEAANTPVVPTIKPAIFTNNKVDEMPKERREYVNRFAATAIGEMHKFGIPASIKLAQGLLESDSGRSGLARLGNNHFGIKHITGKKYKGCNNKGRDCASYQVYESAWESYRAHSQLLKNHRRNRYDELFELDHTDYIGWAKGLKAKGYATDPSYAGKLIRLIERYGLHEFDKM